ncbi:MAG: relaxase/mobilization nuclease domain-containing protein [Lachnospiraceae bacterium]|nr:relaxase/mobilization nuclease domain-containing protein [Lachnospiraceae bacterium]
MKPPKVGKPNGLFFLIQYICKAEKTEAKLICGKDCDPANSYTEMYLTKQRFHKLDGRQYCHFIQSFSPKDEITPEQANEIGKRLMEEFSQFDGFEIVMATHKNRSHIHNHFAINSVNAVTGLKWEQKSPDLYRLKEFSNQLCREHGLAEIPLESKQQKQSYGEWQHRKDGTSWKAQLEADIRDCLSWCRSRPEFYHAINELGYQVTWTKNRKYITFQNADGKKCRNSKLSDPEEFSKEAMQQRLDNNADWFDFMEHDPDLFLDGLRALGQMLTPEHPNSFMDGFVYRDLEGIPLKELLVILSRLKTEQELAAYRRQRELERQANGYSPLGDIANLTEELLQFMEQEDLEF